MMMLLLHLVNGYGYDRCTILFMLYKRRNVRRPTSSTYDLLK
jgi:hypothetical protein